MTDPQIRSFAAPDTDACYEICLRTANNGEDASALYDDPRLVGEVWVGSYLTLLPELAVVVEDDAGVGGYIVGAADTAAYDAEVECSWFPPLRERYPRGSFPAGSAAADTVDLIHKPPVMPADIVEAYPAHLHIDLLPRLQSRGVGRLLMAEYFRRVAAVGAPAVHLGCSPTNTRAIAFYQHLGFEDLMAGFLWGRSTEPL